MNGMNAKGEGVRPAGRGRGFRRPDQDKIELRRPQIAACVSGGEAASCDGENTSKSDPEHTCGQFKLSAEAKEFVPRNFSQPEESNNRLDFDSLHSRGQHENTLDDSVTTFLFDAMEIITNSPGQFEQLLSSIVKKLTPVLSNDTVVKEIVSSILEQAVVEQNFSYNGARLCCALCNCVQPGEKSAFRRVLFNCITDMDKDVESLLELEPSRVYGFVHFLGELYLQMARQKKSENYISVLSTVLLETFQCLLKNPTSASVKTVCGVFKLVGSTLKSLKPKEVDACVHDLKKLLENPGCDPNIKALIQNVVDLCKNNWGHVSDATIRSSLASSSQSNTFCVPDEIVMYGPDGMELTAEEQKFLNESTEALSSDTSNDDTEGWDLGDDVNAEVMAAFEEFLHEQKTRH